MGIAWLSHFGLVYGLPHYMERPPCLWKGLFAPHSVEKQEIYSHLWNIS